MVLLKPFNIIVGFQERDERHVYAGPLMSLGRASVWGLNPSSDIMKSSAVFEKMLSDGTEKLWNFTQNVFKKVGEEGGKALLFFDFT